MHRIGAPYWETTPLDQMTPEQWESLCDGCGKCCLHKLQDDTTGAVVYTNVACAYLDAKTARCTRYRERAAVRPDCLPVTPRVLEQSDWLPRTCAYRLLAERKPLPAWHPLVSGTPDSVSESGNCVAGRIVPEQQADACDQHLIDWVR